MKKITIHDKNSLSVSAMTVGGLVRGTADEGIAPTGEPSLNEQPGDKSGESKVTPYIIADATFNSQLIVKKSVSAERNAVQVKLLTPNHLTLGQHRRFMHVKAADKANALNSQLDRYARLYSKALVMRSEDFGNPGVISPAAPITVIGRIVSEVGGSGSASASVSGVEKLSERSVILESSRQMGSGCRVPLDLSSSGSGGVNFSFFPGQVVALEGVNSDGKTFHVTKQHTPLLLPLDSGNSAPATGGDFTMITAAGPFTTEITTGGRLDFTPFERLLNFAYEVRPNVLLLLGPFIDVENDAIQRGKLAGGTPEHVMQREFMGRLKMLTGQCPDLKVIMTPSTRDLLADPTLPQPAYPADIISMDPTSVLLAPNPAIFSIEGVMVGACSADLFLPLGMSEYSSRREADRLLRLCNHIHQSASFYPLQPAPLGVNIDYDGSLEALEWPAFLDVYFSVSQLRCFARQVQPTLFVNPGQYCRRQAIGTLSLLTVVKGEKRVDFYQF